MVIGLAVRWVCIRRCSILIVGRDAWPPPDKRVQQGLAPRVATGDRYHSGPAPKPPFIGPRGEPQAMDNASVPSRRGRLGTGDLGEPWRGPVHGHRTGGPSQENSSSSWPIRANTRLDGLPIRSPSLPNTTRRLASSKLSLPVGSGRASSGGSDEARRNGTRIKCNGFAVPVTRVLS